MKKAGQLLLILFSLVPFPVVGGVIGMGLGVVLGLGLGWGLGRLTLLWLGLGLAGGWVMGQRVALWLARRREAQRRQDEVQIITDISDTLPGEHLLGLTVLIERPLPELFAYLTQLENYLHWHLATLSMVRMPTHPAGLGAVYEHWLRGGNGRWALLHVTEYQPDAHFAFQYDPADNFPYRRVSCHLAATATGSHLTYIVELSPIERQPFLLAAQRAGLWRDLFNLKKQLDPPSGDKL